MRLAFLAAAVAGLTLFADVSFAGQRSGATVTSSQRGTPVPVSIPGSSRTHGMGTLVLNPATARTALVSNTEKLTGAVADIHSLGIELPR